MDYGSLTWAQYGAMTWAQYGALPWSASGTGTSIGNGISAGGISISEDIANSGGINIGV